jgi:hypothetical protein
MPSVPPAASGRWTARPSSRRAQFGQRHLAHRRRGGQRRAADRAEAGAGADRRHADAAAAVAEEGLGRLEQRLRHAAQRGELAHQQEQRHDRQAAVGVDHLLQVGRQASYLALFIANTKVEV